MRLFAIEWEGKRRDIYTFVCDLCGGARRANPIGMSWVAIKGVAENQKSESAGSDAGYRRHFLSHEFIRNL
jgi:hypothetical protein